MDIDDRRRTRSWIPVGAITSDGPAISCWVGDHPDDAGRIRLETWPATDSISHERCMRRANDHAGLLPLTSVVAAELAAHSPSISPAQEPQALNPVA